MALCKKGVLRICETCHREFRTFPSNVKIGRGRFCCRRCIPYRLLARRHGESRTRLHGIWCHMKTRCYCPTNPAWHYYGARGVRVCDEWLLSFVAFRDWAMANGYDESLEIDRIDVNGNYEPANCRWATRTQQMRNTRKRCDAKTSRFKGVSRHSQNPKWVAQISLSDGKPTNLGSFDSEEEAANAYNAAATKHFGEFASINVL